MINEVVGNTLFCKIYTIDKSDSEDAEKLGLDTKDDISASEESQGGICLDGIKYFFDAEEFNGTTVFYFGGECVTVIMKVSEFARLYKIYLNGNILKKIKN